MTVEIKRKNPDWLKNLLKRYKEESVLAIGYPVGTSAIGLEYPDGTPVVLVAAVNNFGSASRGIPARPFMAQGAEPALEATMPIAKALMPKINEGKATIEQVLEKMGKFAEAAFKAQITDGSWVPNKPETIQRKGSQRPLIDTGLMRNSLTYAVRKGDK